MCGIAGIISKDANKHRNALSSMITSLCHRGPDGSGTYFFQNAALGHTRLSIVDLQTGDQPMIDLRNRLGITFNGEIYGYLSIKETLSGYPFQTTSDTEVILALYDKYGSGMMGRLPGMFAFALWDDKLEMLFCARDRFGEKPFYYAVGKTGELIFASEIKAILATNLIDPVLDKGSVQYYLRRGFIHPSKTIYENVYVLPPAHSLVFRNGHINVQRYWTFPEVQPVIPLSEAVETFRELFIRSVKRQLIADVEVGAFLSGGTDSSSLVTVASQNYPDLKTFSFGYSGNMSELPFADSVAKHCGTHHIVLHEERHDIAELLLQMPQVYDEPLSDSAQIPTFLICKLARQYGKVVLTGEGSDELLGGYPWFKSAMHMDYERNTSAWMMPALFALGVAEKLLEMGRSAWDSSGIIKRKWRDRYLGYMDRKKYGTVLRAYRRYRNGNIPDGLVLGYSPEHNDIFDPAWTETNTMEDALRLDIVDYMAGDILVKTDRASMAHGLELRAPFLDIDFASFCLSLPAHFKINKETDKLILRETFAHEWPEIVRTRPKQGFDAPIHEWLKTSTVSDLMKEHLGDPSKKLYSIVSLKESTALMERNERASWRFLILSLWAERHSYSVR